MAASLPLPLCPADDPATPAVSDAAPPPAEPVTVPPVEVVVESPPVPAWLLAMISHTFFDTCPGHAAFGGSRALRTLWCTDCGQPLCAHCVAGHEKCAVQQVRRNVYRDVVRLADVARVMDTTGVQPYMTNGHRVAFLGRKPVKSTAAAAATQPNASTCAWCACSVGQGWTACSLECRAAVLQAAAGLPPPARAAAVALVPATLPPATVACPRPPVPPRPATARPAPRKRVRGPRSGAAGSGGRRGVVAVAPAPAPTLFHPPPPPPFVALLAARAGRVMKCGGVVGGRCGCKARKACWPVRAAVEVE